MKSFWGVGYLTGNKPFDFGDVYDPDLGILNGIFTILVK